MLIIRDQLKMSLTTLAKLSGVSRTQLWRIENGHSEPSLKTMMKISKALKSEIWDIFEMPDF